MPTPEGITADAPCLPVVDRSDQFPALAVREGSVGHPDVIVPNPGRFEAGTTYKSGRLRVDYSATFRTYLEVYPINAGSMQPNSFALATATNRVDAGVEVLAYYTTGPNGPDVPLFRIWDWSCLPDYPCANGATAPSYTWTVEIRSVNCFYRMLEDNTGHYVNYAYYRNSSWKLDSASPPLWRNAVTFFNFCTSQYDGVYAHDYRFDQGDCSTGGGDGCAWWAGVIEVDNNLPPAQNIAKQGFHHEALEYDGQVSPLLPDDADFILPPAEWQQYYLLPNNTYETGTYQDDDGDGIANTDDVDDDGDGSGDTAEAPCGADPLNPYKRPERVDGAFFQIDDDEDGQMNEALPGGSQTYDCDGDGYNGLAEVNVFPAGSGRDQDPCGTNAWPADFVSGGIPDSTNRVTLMDMTSFLAPVYHLNTSPGDPGFDVRWDIVPGAGLFAKVINLQDLTSVDVVAPPMLNGVKAFNGPPCPWPP